MPYSQIITRAFEIAWRNRALWVIGFIFAFFGGGGGGGFNFSSPSSGSTTSPFDDPTFPAWFTPENLIMFGIIALIISLVLAVIGFVVQSIAHVAMIEGTSLAINDTPLSWRALMSAGWRGRWKSLLGLKFLVALPFIAIFVVIGIVGFASLFPAIQTMIENDSVDPTPLIAGFGVAIFCFACLTLVAVIVQWFLSLISNYAFRAMVLDKQSMGAAWSQGWQLVQTRLLDNILLSILSGVLMIIVGWVVMIPIYFIFAVAAFPMVALMQNPDAISPVVLTVGGIVAVLLFSLLISVLTAPLMAFREAIWTLAYHYLRGREVTTASAPAASPPPI